MYEIVLQNQAEKFFKKLGKPERSRISKKLKELKKDPERGIPLAAGLTGLWKLRIGDYRAIYKIKNKELIVLVLKLGHRKKVYKK